MSGWQNRRSEPDSCRLLFASQRRADPELGAKQERPCTWEHEIDMLPCTRGGEVPAETEIDLEATWKFAKFQFSFRAAASR